MLETAIHTWRQRRARRRAVHVRRKLLRDLDDHLLQDIGLYGSVDATADQNWRQV